MSAVMRVMIAAQAAHKHAADPRHAGMGVTLQQRPKVSSKHRLGTISPVATQVLGQCFPVGDFASQRRQEYSGSLLRRMLTYMFIVLGAD